VAFLRGRRGRKRVKREREGRKQTTWLNTALCRQAGDAGTGTAGCGLDMGGGDAWPGEKGVFFFFFFYFFKMPCLRGGDVVIGQGR